MKRFVQATILFSALHYVAILSLEGLIFLLAHLPTRLIHLDNLILALTGLEKILIFPRVFLRRLWWSEITPGFLNLILLIVNSLIWGTVLAAWRIYYLRHQKN
ncbi:MAG: hypothetical protein M3Y82_07865 [Verrucomicrobiota bacterium]|nr:hypothetical protein [Verrucomicrobiota bacterium]